MAQLGFPSVKYEDDTDDCTVYCKSLKKGTCRWSDYILIGSSIKTMFYRKHRLTIKHTRQKKKQKKNTLKVKYSDLDWMDVKLTMTILPCTQCLVRLGDKDEWHQKALVARPLTFTFEAFDMEVFLPQSHGLSFTWFGTHSTVNLPWKYTNNDKSLVPWL